MELFVAVSAVIAVAIIAVILFKRSRERRAVCAAEARRVLLILQNTMDSLYRGEYIAQSELTAWKSQHTDALRLSRGTTLANCLESDDAVTFRRLCQELGNPEKTVVELNTRFVDARMMADKAAFDQGEKYPLTEGQRRAIVTAEDTTLVIAGAGTGKTSTIVGKVDYLIRRHLAVPSEILVLAFAKKASEELKERLEQFGDAGAVDISTFHALGYRIVGQVEGKRPSLSKLADDPDHLKRYLRDRVREMLSSPDGQELITRWFAEYLDEPETENPGLTADELIRKEQAKGLRAIDGTILNSRQEVQIANWLTLNGVIWEYERPYPVETATPWRRQYRPDFYLPQYDVYVEHFGIDLDGSTAPQVDNARYREAMAWKRALHQEHNTRLIETFSYFKQQGGIIANLARLLTEAGVILRPLSQEQIDTITSEGNRPFSDFVNLIAQFLSVFKGGGGRLDTARLRAATERDAVFLDIFGTIYNDYEAKLASAQDIDFNDMISRARQYAEAGRFRANYKYIIVDEFQDISENRLGLLQALRAQVPHGRLFAVGDDWQSIYRFTGSDVNIITDLPRRVGATARVDLDTTFRYRQELLDVSATFITKNAVQLKKSIRAYEGHENALPLSLMLTPKHIEEAQLISELERSLSDIRLRNPDGPASVFVLGRYNFSKPRTFEELVQKWKRNGLALAFSTAHSSKGKEADYVIILGLEAGEYGFPSNVADDPVMKMVLSAPEDYPYAEERRLFYVAITRARRHVYLMAPQEKASPFVIDDLMAMPLADFVETFGEISERIRCPKCRGHTIRRTEGQYGAFWACSNYPSCRGRLEACPYCEAGGLKSESANGYPSYECTDCKRKPEACPRCRNGYLRQRTSQYGHFLGCSNWYNGSGCTFTRNIPQADTQRLAR